MRFAGIDIGSRTHELAVVDEQSAVLVKPTPITEDAGGYERLFRLLGSAADVLVVLEATGHYWRNLFAALCTRGFRSAVVNPLRIRRFAEEDLRRAKTDKTDAVSIARFGAQKRPDPTPAPDPELDSLRQLVSLHHRLGQDFGDRLRQIHRLVDLLFPEFRRIVRTLDSHLATALLRQWPSARALRQSSPRQLARLRYDGRHAVGSALAASLIEAAGSSVSQHDAPAYESSMRILCVDLDSLRGNLRELTLQINVGVQHHPLASLLTSIDGLGPLTVARLLALVGDPSRFRNAAALASYVGVVPRTSQSGLRRPNHASLSPIGNAELRSFLWMPTLVAVKHNPWLRTHYQRLVARGKPRKLALVAAMRKLLTAIYSVAAHRRPFLPQISPST